MFCQQKCYNNEKKVETNKHAGWNKRAVGIFSQKQ